MLKIIKKTLVIHVEIRYTENKQRNSKLPCFKNVMKIAKGVMHIVDTLYFPKLHVMS
jgi:hypothetical protein